MKNEKLAKPPVKEKKAILSSHNPRHPNSDKVPVLRFSEFKDQWTLEKNKNIIQRISDPVSVQPNTYYKQIGIRSHGKGIFHKEEVDGKSLGNKRVFWIREKSFITNIVFAWEQAVAVTTPQEKGMIASHRFPMYQPIDNKSDVNYLLHFFLTPKGKSLLELASPGGAGRNKTLGQKEFENLSFVIPSIKEQQKIASFLSYVDERLQQLQQKQSLLEQYKKGCMQQLFSQKLRFKDDKGKVYSDWKEKKIQDIFKITRGTVLSMQKVSDVKTITNPFPVYSSQTKNSGVSGFYNSYLFEDAITWTTDGANAGDVNYRKGKFFCTNVCGVLLSDSGFTNLCIAEILNSVTKKYVSYVGNPKLMNNVMASIQIRIPTSLEEQTKIANFLSAIDEQINTVKQQVAQTQQFKKGLLQQLFV